MKSICSPFVTTFMFGLMTLGGCSHQDSSDIILGISESESPLIEVATEEADISRISNGDPPFFETWEEDSFHGPVVVALDGTIPVLICLCGLCLCHCHREKPADVKQGNE